MEGTLARDLGTAQQFQSATEAGLNTGDFAPLVALLAPDVECVMPQHTLYGTEAMSEELSRARPSERLEVEFENGEWTSLGKGRYCCEIHALYRSRATGELSYSRDRTFELTIHAGKVSRCKMGFAN